MRRLALPSDYADETVYDPNMLFVFAAGNNGRTRHLPCLPDSQTCNQPSQDPHHEGSNEWLCDGGGDGIAACNLMAATVNALRQASGTEAAGDRVMFVGALTDDGSKLAYYSQPAGTPMQGDYLVAHDDIFQKGHGSGTSFAAPRVAGAAALVRHKFPSLDGPNLKSVLLMSADDLGETGVDAVFGHGRLNIMSALSPIDGLTK